jgi:hypothetical protein
LRYMLAPKRFLLWETSHSSKRFCRFSFMINDHLPISSDRKKLFSQLVRLIPVLIATWALDISANVTGSEFLTTQRSFAAWIGDLITGSSSVVTENGRILGFAPKKRDREVGDDPLRDFADNLLKLERIAREDLDESMDAKQLWNCRYCWYILCF